MILTSAEPHTPDLPLAVGRTASKPASARRFYAPELDALRLLAFLLIFCRHVITDFGAAQHRKLALVPHITGATSNLSPKWLLAQGIVGCTDFGLPLFFFLSSYLITRLLLLEKMQTGTVAIRDFYIRRCLRIWPLYFVFLAAMGVLAMVAPSFEIRGSRLLASCFFVANIPIVLHGWTGSPIDLLWSVSIEEQFYLVWPRFAAFGRTAIVALSGILALLSFASLIFLGGSPYFKVWPNALVQCLFFAGGAVAATSLSPRFAPGRVQRILLFIGAFFLWIVASAVCQVVKYEGTDAARLVVGYMLVLAGTFLLFLSVLGTKQRIPSFILYLGKISYGLYIFHVLFLQICDRLFSGMRVSLLTEHLTGAVLALISTIAAAALSYRYLESPFLILKKRFTLVASRPI